MKTMNELLLQIDQLQQQIVSEINDIFSRYDHVSHIPDDQREYIYRKILEINAYDDYIKFLEK